MEQMGIIAIPAYVTNSVTKAPINGLSGINFPGLTGGNGVSTTSTVGEYLLSFDSSKTGRICCNVANFQENCVTYINQGVLSFAMQPIQGFAVQFQLTSGGPFVAPANVSVFVDVQGNIALPLQSGTIAWGEGTSSSLNVSAVANGGTSVTHTYGAGGSYTLTCVIVDSKGTQESATTKVTVSAPAPALPLLLTAPGACLSAYNQASLPLAPTVFVGRGDGHLWENSWNQAAGNWLWTDHGTPPGTTVASEPGALLDSAATGLKFMMLTGNGHIFERYWDQATSSWAWTDHGTPPGTTASTAPGACISAYNQASLPLGPSFFVGGADGHLYENYWDQASGWLWTDHGTPPGTTVASEPGALLNSAATGLKFMMLTGNGHIFERYWNLATSSWAWTDHGTPPGTTAGTAPGACISAYNQASLPLTPSFFVGGADGHLWENYWSQTSGWTWKDHGTPPGTILTRRLLGQDSRPGALFNSADAGLKFMMSTGNGHVFENYWDQATSSWGWTDHGTPPGNSAITKPDCALDSAATGIKYFVGGSNGHLWENYWNQATSQWLWTDHGTP